MVPDPRLFCTADYLRHPQYAGLLMAAFGIAIITRSETRLAMAAVLWFVLHQKVRWAAQQLPLTTAGFPAVKSVSV